MGFPCLCQRKRSLPPGEGHPWKHGETTGRDRNEREEAALAGTKSILPGVRRSGPFLCSRLTLGEDLDQVTSCPEASFDGLVRNVIRPSEQPSEMGQMTVHFPCKKAQVCVHGCASSHGESAAACTIVFGGHS